MTLKSAADPASVSFLARLVTLRGWRRLVLAAFSGAVLSFAQPPYGFWPLAFLAIPVITALVLRVRCGRGAFAVGWAAGTGFFAAGLYWVAEAFLVDAATYGWMAPFAILFLATGLALFWGAAFWLAHRVARGSEIWGVVALAAAWTLLEVARSHVLTGFPWALPGYVWVETPVMQGAALIGPHGVGFLTLLAAALPAAIRLDRKATLVAPALAAAALVGMWAWGAARLHESISAEPGGPLLRVVQPNIPQVEKWKPENARWIFDRLLDLTSGGAGDPVPDIVLWPETAVPFYIEREPQAREMIAEALPGEASLILGSLRIVEGADGARSVRNSVVVLDNGGEPAARYDKRHLVPFGEYLPLKPLFSAIGLQALVDTRGGFGTGDHVGPISAPGAPPFTPLICYEAIFPHEVAAASVGAAWLLQVTNDAWFGASIGPPQHLAQARVRAIETGLPLVRAANTGISAVIGPRGEILESLPLGQTGAFDALLPPKLSRTLYARIGDWPIIGLVILALLGAAILFRRVDAATRED